MIKKIFKPHLSKLILGAVLLLLTSCEIFSVIETDKPMIVESKISENRYRINYKYNNIDYFLEIITEEKYEIGDTLRLGK